MNAWMNRGDQQLYDEHMFAPIQWVLWGMLHIDSWCATRRASCCRLETIQCISLSVFGSRWWWMHEWIEQIASFTLNTCLHMLCEFIGVDELSLIGMLPGEREHVVVVVWRLFCQHSCLYLDPSDAACKNNEKGRRAPEFHLLLLLSSFSPSPPPWWWCLSLSLSRCYGVS